MKELFESLSSFTPCGKWLKEEGYPLPKGRELFAYNDEDILKFDQSKADLIEASDLVRVPSLQLATEYSEHHEERENSSGQRLP